TTRPARHSKFASIARCDGRMFTGDGGGDAAAGGEGADDPAFAGCAGGDEIVEQAVDDGLGEGDDAAGEVEGEVRGVQVGAGVIGDVAEGDGAEVGVSGLGAEAGEFGADDLDGVVAAGPGVGEGLQLLARRRFGGHDNSGKNQEC